MTGLRCGHGDGSGLCVPHFAKQNHVRALTESGPQRCHVALGVQPDFPLADNASFMGMQIFQRILQGDDMLFFLGVDRIHHTGLRRGFSASCRACDQNQTAGDRSQADDGVRDGEILRLRKVERDDPDHSGQRSPLFIGIDPETGHTGNG